MSVEITYPQFRELTPEEKDRAIEAIIEHLGRRIERCKFDGEEHGSISLTRERR